MCGHSDIWPSLSYNFQRIISTALESILSLSAKILPSLGSILLTIYAQCDNSLTWDVTLFADEIIS